MSKAMPGSPAVDQKVVDAALVLGALFEDPIIRRNLSRKTCDFVRDIKAPLKRVRELSAALAAEQGALSTLRSRSL